MVAEFITVWVLVTGAAGYRPSVELGPYSDLESCNVFKCLNLSRTKHHSALRLIFQQTISK